MSNEKTKTAATEKDAGKDEKKIACEVLLKTGVETSAGVGYAPAPLQLPEAEAKKLAADGAVKIL